MRLLLVNYTLAQGINHIRECNEKCYEPCHHSLNILGEETAHNIQPLQKGSWEKFLSGPSIRKSYDFPEQFDLTDRRSDSRNRTVSVCVTDSWKAERQVGEPVLTGIKTSQHGFYVLASFLASSTFINSTKAIECLPHTKHSSRSYPEQNRQKFP